MDASILPTSQTLMTLMTKLMLCSYHSWICDLMKEKATMWSLPQLLLSLALVLASPWHLAFFLLSCPRPTLGHLPLFGGSWEVGWSWGQILVSEIKWHHCRWNKIKPIQALLVQCVLQWWLGWLTTCLHLGLWVWHWVVLAYQPMQ